MNARLFLTAILAVICVACSAPVIDYRVPGAQLLVPFKADLKIALVTGMKTGPVEAISACSVEAPRIAEGLSVDGVVMGRSSHKLRNPENAARDWVAPVIELYLEDREQQVATVTPLGEDRYGYVEPIRIQPMCLACHGEVLQPDIAERIREHYPEDQATGFKEGDLRGVFWVEFSSGQAGKSAASPDSSTS